MCEVNHKCFYACMSVYMFLSTPGTQNNNVVKSRLRSLHPLILMFHFPALFIHLFVYPSLVLCLPFFVSLFIPVSLCVSHPSILSLSLSVISLSINLILFLSLVPAYLYPCLPFLISLFPSEKCNLLTAQLSDE